MVSDRSKYIHVRYFFVRDLILKRILDLEYVRTDENVADIFTKVLSVDKTKYFVAEMGMI